MAEHPDQEWTRPRCLAYGADHAGERRPSPGLFAAAWDDAAVFIGRIRQLVGQGALGRCLEVAPRPAVSLAWRLPSARASSFISSISPPTASPPVYGGVPACLFSAIIVAVLGAAPTPPRGFPAGRSDLLVVAAGFAVAIVQHRAARAPDPAHPRLLASSMSGFVEVREEARNAVTASSCCLHQQIDGRIVWRDTGTRPCCRAQETPRRPVGTFVSL